MYCASIYVDAVYCAIPGRTQRPRARLRTDFRTNYIHRGTWSSERMCLASRPRHLQALTYAHVCVYNRDFFCLKKASSHHYRTIRREQRTYCCAQLRVVSSEMICAIGSLQLEGLGQACDCDEQRNRDTSRQTFKV